MIPVLVIYRCSTYWFVMCHASQLFCLRFSIQLFIYQRIILQLKHIKSIWTTFTPLGMSLEWHNNMPIQIGVTGAGMKFWVGHKNKNITLFDHAQIAYECLQHWARQKNTLLQYFLHPIVSLPINSMYQYYVCLSFHMSIILCILIPCIHSTMPILPCNHSTLPIYNNNNNNNKNNNKSLHVCIVSCLYFYVSLFFPLYITKPPHVNSCRTNRWNIHTN